MIEDTSLADEVLDALQEEDLRSPCTWTDNEDEHRRVWVLVQFMSDDLEKMDKICKWLKDGTLPTKLKAVH